MDFVPGQAQPAMYIANAPHLQSSGIQTTYTYDAAGNRQTMTVGNSITNYCYNALNQVTASGTASCGNSGNAQYTYDARGNVTFNSVQPTGSGSVITAYTWDARDRLISASLPGGQSASFAYDDGGHRIQQNAAGQVTNYLWDEQSSYGDVIQETDGTGAPTASYVLGGTELLTQTRGGVTSYYLHDGQGSVRTLTDTSGVPTDTYTYDAYGSTQNHTRVATNPYLYTGQQLDQGTGLYDLRARYYNPGDGRFLSRDTFAENLTDPNQIDRYGYATNNPINSFDPTGNDVFISYGLAIASVATVAVAALATLGVYLAIHTLRLGAPIFGGELILQILCAGTVLTYELIVGYSIDLMQFARQSKDKIGDDFGAFERKNQSAIKAMIGKSLFPGGPKIPDYKTAVCEYLKLTSQAARKNGQGELAKTVDGWHKFLKCKQNTVTG